MLISRRSTIVSAAAATVCSTASLPAFAIPALPRPALRQTQRVQHLVIHEDESGDQAYFATLAIAAADTAWKAHGAMNETAYHTALTSYRQRGYDLHRVNAFQTRGGLRYAAIWQLGHGAPAQVRHDMTLTEFRAAAARAGRQGLAMTHLDASATAQGARFAAIWRKADGAAQQIHAGLTAAQYQDRLATLAPSGFGPSQVAGYADGGEARFAVVFAKDGLQREVAHAIPAAEFHARARAMRSAGYQLRDVNGYVAGGQPYYAGVWDKA